MSGNPLEWTQEVRYFGVVLAVRLPFHFPANPRDLRREIHHADSGVTEKLFEVLAKLPQKGRKAQKQVSVFAVFLNGYPVALLPDFHERISILRTAEEECCAEKFMQLIRLHEMGQLLQPSGQVAYLSPRDRRVTAKHISLPKTLA